MSEVAKSAVLSQHQLRVELEAMALGDLLGPAGGGSEEPTEQTVRDRSLVGVLAPSHLAGAAWMGCIGHVFHETKQRLRFTIGEPARREVLQRLLKLNHERYAGEVRQGLLGEMGTVRKVTTKKKAGRSMEKQSSLFAFEEDSE